jgi:hypothetical protein
MIVNGRLINLVNSVKLIKLKRKKEGEERKKKEFENPVKCKKKNL